MTFVRAFCFCYYDEMYRIRLAEPQEKPEIVALYQLSQADSGIPDPVVYPPATLGEDLFGRQTLERFVAVADDKIVGHGITEIPNPLSVAIWRQGLAQPTTKPLIEFGAGFVHPEYTRRGIHAALLVHRLQIIRDLGAVPVSTTWLQNVHVQKNFLAHGGREVGRQEIKAGTLCLFVFDSQP